MSRDLAEFLLFIFGQIRFHVFCITAQQVNTCGDHDVQINDSRATTLSLTLRRSSQLPRARSTGYYISRFRTVTQIGGHRFDAVRSD
jgi:hypothetical protein